MKRQREASAAEEAPATRRPAALAWMRSGGGAVVVGERDVAFEDLSPPLDGQLEAALRRGGVERLFPVQAAVWGVLAGGEAEAHDVCVCAPTGGGKTLAYALPTVAALQGRVVRRLRALVVLPTHDLALQGALKAEQDLLVDACTGSCVDVLVATPGRLVAHLQSTPGFTLTHLRLLVVDEADRLLRQAYQDWLPLVLQATAPAPRDAPVWGSTQQWGSVGAQRRFRGGLQGDRVATPRLVKLVLSATMTRDPSKVGQLHLHSPRLVSVGAPDERCQLPKLLEQYRVVVAGPGSKPFALLSLLQSLHASSSPSVVFTSSVDATHSLFLLLCALRDAGAPIGSCVEYSSLQRHAARSDALAAFSSGKATVLVASDAATRGLDVEGIEAVISYDTPVFLKTYVHRVGRTARAGRSGRAYTLLRPEEVRHFKLMLKKAGGKVRAHQLAEDVKALEERYAEQVRALLPQEAPAKAGFSH